ncbi:MAG: alpha/beta fold hydrolase [Pyrinomonadaceae bacterium]
MAFVLVKGLKIGFSEEGNGVPVVFLHGVGSDKALWNRQLNYFSKRWCAVSLDYPGYGESDLAPNDLRREEIAAYLCGALDALGIKAAHFVGLSMGGVMALEIWRQQPARLRSMVLADTFAKHPHAVEIVERAHHALATMPMQEFAQLRVPMVLSSATPDETQREVVENMARINKHTYKWAAEAVWTGDYRAALASINIPTLVVVGEHDNLTPLALSEELRAGIAGAKLKVIPDAGHISNIDNPTEFNRAVEHFIAAVET